MLTRLRRLVPGLRSSAPERDTLRVVADDHPKDAFFTRPLVVTSLTTSVEDVEDVVRARSEQTAPEVAPDTPASQVRVSFVATIKDADGKRCPDMAVYARITGPHRSATGMGHTSLLGQVTFRMSGPPGDYACIVEDVAGGALGLDTDASVLHAEVVASPA